MSMQYVYGIHAVDSLLRQKPETVQLLCVQEGRADKRIASVQQLALNQGITVERRPRKELDDLAQGRHQGVVARVTPRIHPQRTTCGAKRSSSRR